MVTTVTDFDNGATTRDVLGRLINLLCTGLGQNEGLISPGDNGGPAFINGQIVGIPDAQMAGMNVLLVG